MITDLSNVELPIHPPAQRRWYLQVSRSGALWHLAGGACIWVKGGTPVGKWYLWRGDRERSRQDSWLLQGWSWSRRRGTGSPHVLQNSCVRYLERKFWQTSFKQREDLLVWMALLVAGWLAGVSQSGLSAYTPAHTFCLSLPVSMLLYTHLKVTGNSVHRDSSADGAPHNVPFSSGPKEAAAAAVE